MNPNLFKLTAVRHAERLQEAATARHFMAVGLPKPSLQKRGLLSLSRLLIASGRKLKGQTVPKRATPATRGTSSTT